MNKPQRAITGITLLIMAEDSLGYPLGWLLFEHVGERSRIFYDLLAIVFIWGALFVFLGFIKKKKSVEGDENNS